MIFISAQPDEIYFSWQIEVQLHNFRSKEIDLKKVYVLIGTKEGVDSQDTQTRWNRVLTNYPEANVIFIPDLRESKGYPPSIRPFLLKTFFAANPKLGEEYIFYCDSDVIFTNEFPAFEAMQDGRWHISHADYISHHYIAEKNSPSLMRDMLGSVGIPESIVKGKGQNVGGVQYFITDTNSDFWNKIEQDCERMWKTFHNNFHIYSKEFEVQAKRPMTGNDFQIWCTDMWCIYWNALLFGIDVYVNPELKFAWPNHTYESLEEDKIYHETGTGDPSRWFNKGNYKTKTPFGEDLSKLGYDAFGNKTAQRMYLEIIEDISANFTVDIKKPIELPLVSCLMTTYGRFECVERSIAFWLNQDYPNKELIILNTAEIPLTLDANLENKGIRIINNEYIHNSNPVIKYSSVDQVRKDILKLANGEYYICWDDDDMYMPFHISQGMKYIIEGKKVAWMPEKSYWSPDGGNTIELASNSMEASCIVKISELKKYGFSDNTNGAEHLAWRHGMRDDGLLDEHFSVTPLESYVYVWGEDIASHKQSGSINDPNCFENHKLKSNDFGVRPLNLYSPIRIKLWYKKITDFANSLDLNSIMQPYL